jgi:hypothetical protein
MHDEAAISENLIDRGDTVIGVGSLESSTCVVIWNRLDRLRCSLNYV